MMLLLTLTPCQLSMVSQYFQEFYAYSEGVANTGAIGGSRAIVEAIDVAKRYEHGKSIS